jgi:hypothetical protein
MEFINEFEMMEDGSKIGEIVESQMPAAMTEYLNDEYIMWVCTEFDGEWYSFNTVDEDGESKSIDLKREDFEE